jgi:hypothetical protein
MRQLGDAILLAVLLFKEHLGFRGTLAAVLIIASSFIERDSQQIVAVGREEVDRMRRTRPSPSA